MENSSSPQPSPSEDPSRNNSNNGKGKAKVKKSTLIIILVVSVIFGIANLGSQLQKDEQKITDDMSKMIQDLDLNDEFDVGVNNKKQNENFNYESIEMLTEFGQKLKPLADQINEILESYFLLEDMMLINLEASQSMLATFKKDWEQGTQEIMQLYDDFEEELNDYNPKDKNEEEMIKGMLTSIKRKKQDQFDLLDKSLALFDLDIERLNYLSNNKDLYIYNDETNEIESGDDGFIEEYGKIVDKYNTAADEYNALSEQALEQQKESQEKFEKLLNN